MAAERLTRAKLAGKVIDGHSHAGVSLKAYALGEYPYAQTVEGLAAQQATGGVAASVVFPFSADLFFEPAALPEGRLVPAAEPLSPAPYAAENRLLLREIFDYCPELSRRFLPFVSIDPAREVAAQVRELTRLAGEHPFYGIKVNPVGCQSRAAELLGAGAALLDFAEERGLPLLFHATTLPGEEYSQAADIFRIIERRPKLRFCLAHGLLFHRGWLDRAAAAPNVWVDTAAMKIQVEFMRGELASGRVARGDFLEADFSDHLAVMRALCDRHPDMVVWGSDSPAYSWICRRKQGEGVYQEFRLKGAYADEVAALNALGPELRAKVGGANALDFVFGPG
ncbi:MAG TPA: amidohydrolase family protein [Planctomycetota bacterium]|nr:amidohydrolase family protein [Planctomycetota bacterium]